MSKTIKNTIMIIAMVICFALIIIGQKNISVTGLVMEIVGLIGLLILLYLYNARFK